MHLIGSSGLLATLAVEAPHFLLAWLVWLVPLCRAQRYPPHSLHFFRASLLLSLATIAAILLPNKGMLNYYLLLTPTAVVVMATGLARRPWPCQPRGIGKVPCFMACPTVRHAMVGPTSGPYTCSCSTERYGPQDDPGAGW